MRSVNQGCAGRSRNSTAALQIFFPLRPMAQPLRQVLDDPLQFFGRLLGYGLRRGSRFRCRGELLRAHGLLSLGALLCGQLRMEVAGFGLLHELGEIGQRLAEHAGAPAGDPFVGHVLCGMGRRSRQQAQRACAQFGANAAGNNSGGTS